MDSHFESFRAVYGERLAAKYGFWRSVVDRSLAAFLRCGDLYEGFARVRCPDCQHEMFVAYSCKQRCTCPSCHQKRTLLTAMLIKRVYEVDPLSCPHCGLWQEPVSRAPPDIDGLARDLDSSSSNGQRGSRQCDQARELTTMDIDTFLATFLSRFMPLSRLDLLQGSRGFLTNKVNWRHTESPTR